MKTISVAKDFSCFPSGRWKVNGEASGQGLREILLEPELRAGNEIMVDLDGTMGFSSAFLEEAFGGIVRSLDIEPERLLNLLHFKSDDDPSLVEEVIEYILDAAKKPA
ncbi:STAS-like domain-containing protein [Oxalobacteraceae bacterium]|nr:STAS-like domain-containing protein [Oxalobacteraceae bacterium]